MTEAPKRIQRKRTKGWRMPPNTVYVGRGTMFGNPFNATQVAACFHMWGYPKPLVKLHSPPSLERCIDMYTAWLMTNLSWDSTLLDRLRGKDLACWCPLGKLCHADVLLRLANR